MNYIEVKKNLVYICNKIQNMGFTQGSGGNISCRVPGTDLAAIKRSGVNMGEMTENEVLIVDFQGNIMEGEGTPSKEVNFHLGLLKMRPEISAVVHCHPNCAIAFANCHLEMPHTTCTSRKYIGRVPWIGYAAPGSAKLKDLVLGAFEDVDVRAILMDQHGICTVGKTLLEAFNLADIVEQTCKQALFICEIRQNRAFFESMKL